MKNPLVNYLRAHRRRAGLSQREVAWLLGYSSQDAVSKHKLFESIPSLIMAFRYQAIFRVPVSELFAGLCGAIDGSIEKELLEFENKLLHQIGQKAGRPAPALLRKLEWLKERSDVARK